MSGFGNKVKTVKFKKNNFLSENNLNPTEKFIKILKDTLSGNRELKGDYAMPYSDSDDDRVNFVIKYHVTKISMWKVSSPHCQYEGVIYVKVDDVSVGFEGTNDWENGYKITDLPSWIEDDFMNSIYDDISIFGKLCLDIDYSK